MLSGAQLHRWQPDAKMLFRSSVTWTRFKTVWLTVNAEAKYDDVG